MKKDEGGRMKDELATGLPQDYAVLFSDIKHRVRHAQTRAMLAVNAELIRLYWEIGALINNRQKKEGWGAGVISRLARDLHNELPEEKGFSERNIKRMLAFYREYPPAICATGCGTNRIRPKSATDCGIFDGRIDPVHPLGASQCLDGQSKRSNHAPMVHAGHRRKWLESQYTGDANRIGGIQSIRAGNNQFCQTPTCTRFRSGAAEPERSVYLRLPDHGIGFS